MTQFAKCWNELVTDYKKKIPVTSFIGEAVEPLGYKKQQNRFTASHFYTFLAAWDLFSRSMPMLSAQC